MSNHKLFALKDQEKRNRLIAFFGGPCLPKRLTQRWRLFFISGKGQVRNGIMFHVPDDPAKDDLLLVNGSR